MKKITFTMIFITMMLSFIMIIFQNPLLANTENSEYQLRDVYLNIITANKPQADMVKKIVKDKHSIQYMITELKDINDFEYDDDIINNVSKMDLFIYSGGGFEPWINKFISKLKKGNVGIINLARGIRLLNYESDDQIKENPYYFEGIDEYKIALYNVKNCIQDKDPKNRDYYEKNYNKAIKEFDEKVKENEKQIKPIKEYTFITLDNRFDYILKSLDLKYMNIGHEYLNEFIKNNNLDIKKVVIIQDGDDLVDLKTLIDDDKEKEDNSDESVDDEVQQYKIIQLWKYYGDMSFDELILYNIGQIDKFADYETKNKELGTIKN